MDFIVLLADWTLQIVTFATVEAGFLKLAQGWGSGVRFKSRGLRGHHFEFRVESSRLRKHLQEGS